MDSCCQSIQKTKWLFALRRIHTRRSRLRRLTQSEGVHEVQRTFGHVGVEAEGIYVHHGIPLSKPPPLRPVSSRPVVVPGVVLVPDDRVLVAPSETHVVPARRVRPR